MQKKKTAVFSIFLMIFILFTITANPAMAEDARTIRSPREPVRIVFSLNGGSAPASNPDIFLPKYTEALYSHGDTVPVDEFVYFKDIKPILEGDEFEGWRFDVEDENGNPIGISNAYYQFDEGIALVPAALNYRIHFYAGWRSGHMEDDKYPVIIDFDLKGGNAPADASDVFDRRETAGKYQFLDQIPPSEFEFFKDKKPVKDGYNFKGWKVLLVDSDNNAISETMDYTYGPLLLSSGTADGHYGILFVAVWSMSEPGQDPDPVEVKISFDLHGGAEPSDHAGIFKTRIATAKYAPDEWLPESEFTFFKGIKPVKDGFTFEGWRFDVYDHNNKLLEASNAYYPFDAIHLPAGDHKGYEIRFNANWEKTNTPPASTPKDNPKTGDNAGMGKWIAIVGLALACVIIVAVLIRKKSGKR